MMMMESIEEENEVDENNNNADQQYFNLNANLKTFLESKKFCHFSKQSEFSKVKVCMRLKHTRLYRYRLGIKPINFLK